MTFHPTTGAQLADALNSPEDAIIDCDILKEQYGNNSINIPPVWIDPSKTYKELIGRNCHFWTNAKGHQAACHIFGGPNVSGSRQINFVNYQWRTNAERVMLVNNVTDVLFERVLAKGANIGWEIGQVPVEGDNGQCEQISLDGCGGSEIKYDCLLFNGGSFNATRIDAFKGHHHNNPDDGATAYMCRVKSGSLYGSKLDLYGWQDDKENQADYRANNKGMKVHAEGNVSRSTINIDLENGGFYLMKIVHPNPSFPWEGPHARQHMSLDFDSITLSGTWPYAYGFILDQLPQGDSIEKWVEVDDIEVNGGHFRGYGKEADMIVGIEEGTGNIVRTANTV